MSFESLNMNPQENKLETQETGKFESVSNFEELYVALREAGGVEDSRGKFKSAEEVINFVENIRKDSSTRDVLKGNAIDYVLTPLTRNEGLRDKVKELLQSEFGEEN